MKRDRQKKILVRITAIFIICFVIMMALGTVVLIDVLIKPVEQMEKISIQNDLSSIQKAVDNKIDNLSTLVKVWAVSDDSYQFIQDGNENHLPDSDITNLGVSMMLYINNNGQVVYGKSVQSDDEIKETVNESVIDCMSRFKILWIIDPDYGFRGIWTLPEGPMLVASHPVVRSDESGPVMGHIVFGQYLDENALKELSNSLNLDISISMIGSKEYTQLKAGNHQSFGIVKVQAVNSEKIEGSQYVPALLNDTAISLNVTEGRDIYKVGQTTVLFTVVTVAVIFFVVLLLLWTLTNKYVVKRVSNLHKDVTKIAEEKNLSGRVEINGSKDEIYYLSANINSMLDVTEELNKKIQKTNDKLEKRTEELVKANEALLVEKNKIKHMAYHDNLTSLPNGVYFNDFLNREINSSDRIGKTLAVLFIDLDGFKMINDTLGHAAGDELLISVSKRLNTVLRKSDFIARIEAMNLLF